MLNLEDPLQGTIHLAFVLQLKGGRGIKKVAKSYVAIGQGFKVAAHQSF